MDKTVMKGLAALARGAVDDPGKALKAAGMATAAARTVSSARKIIANAVRDVVEEKDAPRAAPPAAEPPVPPRDPIDELAAQSQAKPETSGFRAMVESAVAAYRSERAAAGYTPDDPDPIARAGEAVLKTLPAIRNKAGDLVDLATPVAPDGLKRLGRGLAGRMSGADIAREIGRVDVWKGMVGGTSKLAYLGILLGRMTKADVDVFQALDAFSNHNTERNKALSKICNHIGDMRIDAETAVATLKGFQLTNGKPDYGERKTALRSIAPNLDRDEVPRVIEGYSDEERQRHEALRVVAELYNSLTAVEMVELLKIFGPKTRAKARAILEPKLADKENIQLVNDLFEPKKGLADFPELERLTGALGRFVSGFNKGNQKQ